MADGKIKFTLVTPERTVFTEQVDALSCPTVDGQITILPQHIPLISTLGSGELVAHISGDNQHIAVSGGFVEVRPGNEVLVLADSAERDIEIDEQRATEAKLRAEQSMKNSSRLSEEEYAQLAAELQKNLTRLRVVRRKRRHHETGEVL